jgi:predicted regulator of Ras-like GTPase activity (Roadblock/LC7/MglB family)
MLSWTSDVQVSRALTGRQCEALLAHLEQDVEGFTGAAVVELTSGGLLATHCVQPSFDMASFVRTALLAVRAHRAMADRENSALEEIAVADARHFYLYQLLSPTVLLVVAAQRVETTMAMLRAVVRGRALPMADRIVAAHLMMEMDENDGAD